ncbi:hypothetical protein BDU57DRAFT_542642 [Ampelomyces quisqualis]|uniref:Uncharacterized protein n=1 Tax=Ampelomyces quisqualis TaxID=50730 RepID=A0A6A5Q9K9_AMPQU|nr:hypothetical protein BDU57DRAFT_542642 [Ampelomyces quisqualis]
MSIFAPAPAPAPAGAGGLMGGCSGFTAASTIISAALGIFMGTRSRGVKQDVFSNVDVVKTNPRAEFFALETDELKSYVDRIGDFGTVTVIVKDTTAPAPPQPSPSSSAFATTLLATSLSGLSSLPATLFSLPATLLSGLSSLSPLLASMAYDFAFNLLVWQTVSWGLYLLLKFSLWAHRTTRHLIDILRAIPALLALLKSLPSSKRMSPEAMNAFQRTVASLQSDDVEGHLAAVLVAVQDELKHTSLQLSRANAGSRTTFTPSSAAPNTQFGPQNGSLFRGFWAGGGGYNSSQELNKAFGA